MNRVDYIEGQKFEGTRLTFLKEVDRTTSSKRRALFQCECGQTTESNIAHVLSKRTASCGCLFKEIIPDVNLSHGQNRRGKLTGAYRSWISMHYRVKHDPHYAGISVCDRWAEFEKFYEDMGARPENYSIERVNGKGDYTPGNCIWADDHTQAANRSTSVFVTINGRTEIISEWCRIYGISRFTVNSRVRSGMDLVTALITPLQRKRK